MSDWLRKVLSHDCGPFWQFVKYGVIGVMATCVQVAVFYLMAATCLKCLAADDWAVRLLGLPSVAVADSVRAWRFAAATVVGFCVANVFCWLMNRWFVFRAGRFRWYVEFLCFLSVSAVAMCIATFLSGVLINSFGLMTSVAFAIEVVVSFLFNYFIRRFFIFKG
ncbi:MAG: GtrA family protein [Kiritimatiellae bacterium]|nr:GtrA family protein [Kiritimatiellia bacterium]